jgi:hypothetical protein
VIAPTVTKSWGETPAPFHYIVFDKSGNCLVIEPIEGQLVTYENQFDLNAKSVKSLNVTGASKAYDISAQLVTDR